MEPNARLAPTEILEALMRYREHGVPTGSFLEAVLENNLSEAVGRADYKNLEALPHIVAWVYSYMPRDRWGNREKVVAWLKLKEEERKKERGGA